MDDMAFTCIVQSEENLLSKMLHEGVQHLTFKEQCTEACKTLHQRFKDKAYVASIRTNVLEGIKQSWGMSISRMSRIGILQAFLRISNSDVFLCTVAFRTEDFQRSVTAAASCWLARKHTVEYKP